MRRDMASTWKRQGRSRQWLQELRREAQVDSQRRRRVLARRMWLRGVKAERKWGVRRGKPGAWGMWVLRRVLATRMRWAGEWAEGEEEEEEEEEEENDEVDEEEG